MSVIGFVDNVDVIAFSNQIQGKWSTSTSVCLPSDFAKAAEYIDCFNQTLAKVKEIQKKESEVSDVIKGGVVASANDEQIRVLFDFSVFDEESPSTIRYKGKLYVRGLLDFVTSAEGKHYCSAQIYERSCYEK